MSEPATVSELVPQPATIPPPTPSAHSKPYWDGTRIGELRYQRCEACATPLFDPAVICRKCGSRALRWERSAGLGTVYSWTVVWRPQQPAFVVPYAPAIVADKEADLHVRAWRFSYNARGIIEMPNRLQASKTAVIMVHPWGVDDGQGWRTPEPAGAAPVEPVGEVAQPGLLGKVRITPETEPALPVLLQEPSMAPRTCAKKDSQSAPCHPPGPGACS